MDSVDKLREAARLLEVTGMKPSLYEIADEIEAKIERDYMRLPVDADGVPIRVGDEMTCHGDVFKVCAIAPAKIHRWVVAMLPEKTTTYSYDPKECTHYHAPTVEDVLREFVDAYERESGRVEFDTLDFVGEYAEKIREVMRDE